ncbi:MULTISPECIES: preprotein translocase subunit SecY [Aneurinibacillus]|uniref:Protein translocase subunit SecY n=1 Tax=Aneurinibacillus thermoaerophilus TaxID=143495 RepID=A0A1G8C432_ANETH|nr:MULTISPECIES: preprotein translocase subunit SecY [Aneurinibacillus]AMA74407.1 preprotein translocase subunit SecY [Aneurinibacillus sp. XH2]MED0674494.1 preprotein translocase subunit SecY [Aneurinibacillus thermoaerophilus]MED0679200.1 preprotein translocase subunit SecY [Aneurinibacillus thermoaerophilus]MED0738202.1 preprotein translocase subunit SecY [Aneurinibacillus thermoaerophilus]MED0757509.1 preprotein translocase subunit SecY [Aneurinibacillus thermoaerophilus]
MFSMITNIFKIADLRRKVMFTLLMLVVFRIGSFVPVPNINVSVLEQLSNQSSVFGFFNTFTGGALQNFSIFAMGIMPYITASIIMQLLSMDVVPTFTQWSKEGDIGRRKIAQVTRYLTIILGLIQAVGLSIGFNRMIPGLVIDPSFTTYALIALVLTAGTAFLMWLGEQITEKGIGNGISIIIFAGIVAGIPNGVKQIYASEFIGAEDQMFLNVVKVLLILLAVILVIVGIVFIQQGARKVPVQYAKRVVGRKMYGGQSTHIPLKVNSAGVIPVIFALSLIIFPPTIAQFWPGHPVSNWVIQTFNIQTFSSQNWIGMVLYVLLIIGFTYFYVFVQVNPTQMADNMKKNGGYIPGIRPGNETAQYITRTLNRITLAGAIFLAAVSILPIFFTKLSGLPASVQIGGTALLIVIGVALDTMKQIESQLVKRHYKGFIK